jgi:hypothetical protein
MRVCTIKEYHKTKAKIDALILAKNNDHGATNYRKAFEKILEYMAKHDLLSKEELEQFKRKLL